MTLLCPRRGLVPLALALAACGPTFAVEQSSIATLPTAPPPAASSGRAAIDLGASVAADATEGPAVRGESGLAVARAQPEGALTVRVTDLLALRAWGAVALPQGATQVTGTIDAPEEAAWMGALGPVLRLRGAENLVALELGLALGFVVVPSNMRITRMGCPDGSSGCPDATFSRSQREVMPMFALRSDMAFTPSPWFRMRGGVTVRNQPVNEASFNRAVTVGSSVSAGPIGLVLHAGVEVDFIDAVGARAEVQWPAIGMGLAYGPVFTFGLQGRIGGGLDEPLGLEL